MSALHEPDGFTAFCREKGLIQADLDVIARELSARVANTTNDEQAKYGKEGDQPKREPMLSDEEMLIGLDDIAEDAGIDESSEGNAQWQALISGARSVIAYYEDLIDRGVLAVVKTATAVRDEVGSPCCGLCGHIVEDYHGDPYRHCPGCGAKIVEP